MTPTREGPCGLPFARDDALLLTCGHPVCATCAHPGDSGSPTRPTSITCQRCDATSSSADLIPDHVTRHIVKVQHLTNTTKECDNGCPEWVTFRCYQCPLDLCSRCAHVHPRSQRFKDHNVVEVRQVGPGDVVIPVDCNVHQGLLMTAYCTMCNVLICSECFLSKTSPHATHVRESLDVANARDHAELTPLFVPPGGEDPLEPLLGAAIDKVKATRAALPAHLAMQLDSINAQEEATIMRVKEEATAKRDKITAAVERTDAALKVQEAALRQHGSLLRQLNDYTHALLAMVKGSELVEVVHAIKERIEEARNVEVHDVRPVVVPETFPHFVQQRSTIPTLTLGMIMEHPITKWTMRRKGTPKAVYMIGG